MENNRFVRFTCFISVGFLVFCLTNTSVIACDVDDLDDLVGYTLIDITDINGTFEGAEFGKPVRLGNGMLFEFTEYNYSYSYHPDVAVFARTITEEQLKKMNLKNIPARAMTVYKLLIEDDLYDVRRIQ